MSEAVLLVLILSVTGTIPALILFALKPLIRHRSSKTLQYYLWMIVLLRFVLPFSLPVSGINLKISPVNVSSAVFRPNGNSQSIMPAAAGELSRR